MTQSKGCFFVEDKGELVTHQFQLDISKTTPVWITLEPFSLKPGSKK